MLKPALLYTNEITRKFTEHLYTTDYFYYCGYYCGSSLPNNGYIHHWHETTKDECGNYVDSYTYEILRDESSNET